MLSIFAETAQRLIAGGYSPLPVGPGVKYPARYVGYVSDGSGPWVPMHGWQQWCSEQPPTAKVDAWGRMTAVYGGGVGVACGYGGLVAVDIDQDDLIEPMLAVLPPVVVAKRGRKGLTVFYRSEEQLPKKNYRTPEKRGLGDFLGYGSQTVLPPTIHPDTGKAYEWTTSSTLLDTPLTGLPLFTRAHFAEMEAVFAQHGWESPADLVPERREPNNSRARVSGGFASDDDFDRVATSTRAQWLPKLRLHGLRRDRGGWQAVASFRASGSGKPLGKRRRNLSIRDTGAIRDHAAGQGYNNATLVAECLRISVAEAFDWLHAEIGYPAATCTPGTPVAPSYADHRVSLSDAEDAITALVGGAFKTAILEWRVTRNRQMLKPSLIVPSPSVLVGRIETGLGKTRAGVLGCTLLARAGYRVVYAVQRHDLADAVAEQFAALGVVVEVYRGYEQPDPLAPGHAMCRNLPAYEAARTLGVGIRGAICERWDGERKIRCKFADVCGRERQRESKPKVWIVTAALLPFARPDFVFDGGPQGTPLDALVVDERFHDKTIGDPQAVAVAALIRSKIEGCDLTERDALARLRRALQAAIEANGDGPVSSAVLSAHGIFAHGALRAAHLERRCITSKLLSPDMSEAELKGAAYRHAPRTGLARSAGALWEEIALFLAFGKPESGRLSVSDDKITTTPLRSVHPSWHAPTLILDATAPADSILAPALFGDDVTGWPTPRISTTDIAAYWPDHLYVRQIKGAPITMERLGLWKDPKPQNETDVLRFIRFRAALAAPALIGVITYKGFRKRITGKLPSNVILGHFGAISGTNSMASVVGLIVIGRPAPNRAAVEAIASVLSGQPLHSGAHRFERAKGGIRLAPSGAVETNAIRHPEPVVEALRWQITEAELLQAVGRLRPHRRVSPCWLDIVCDVPLPIRVHEVMEWVKPSAAGDMVSEGFVLTNSRDAITAFGLSKHAAERVGNCPELSNKNPIRDFGAVSPVRTFRYRKAGQRGPRSQGYLIPAMLPGGVAALRTELESKLGPVVLEVERARAVDSNASKAMFARIGREATVAAASLEHAWAGCAAALRSIVDT